MAAGHITRQCRARQELSNGLVAGPLESFAWVTGIGVGLFSQVFSSAAFAWRNLIATLLVATTESERGRKYICKLNSRRRHFGAEETIHKCGGSQRKDCDTRQTFCPDAARLNCERRQLSAYRLTRVGVLVGSTDWLRRLALLWQILTRDRRSGIPKSVFL